jgi:hypothetical protein
MKDSMFSIITALVLPSLTHQHFIWRPYIDNPGTIFINNDCPFYASISEVWQGGGDGPSCLGPFEPMKIPLRESGGVDEERRVDVNFSEGCGPPQSPVTLNYTFNAANTKYKFDLVTKSDRPDFDGSISIIPNPSTGKCQWKYWYPGEPPVPPEEQVCRAGTNIQINLCGDPPYYQVSLSGPILSSY